MANLLEEERLQAQKHIAALSEQASLELSPQIQSFGCVVRRLGCRRFSPSGPPRGCAWLAGFQLRSVSSVLPGSPFSVPLTLSQLEESSVRILKSDRICQQLMASLHREQARRKCVLK